MSMRLSPPPSNRFLRRSPPFYACLFFLACLVLFHITLLTLKATHFFEKHPFDVRKISAVSRLASVTTQTCTVIILITLSYAMQIVSSDAIIRRRQSVAALHDNLMAWRGLGSSILALWRSRKLDVRTRLRVLLAFMFFGGVSVLHIVTPSVITVGTFNATRPVSLNVSTISMPNYNPWMGEQLPLDPTAALPYLWSQLGTNPTVGLPGLNGSVMFSTLPSVMTGDVVFQDLYARDLSVRCGIIPRASGDSFQVLYTGPGNISSFPAGVSLHFHIQTVFAQYPEDGFQSCSSTLYLSMSSGAFAIGGNKESINAHPVFWFDDILLYLLSSDYGVANAFAYISMQNDSLKLDPLVSFAPPVQYTLQAQTWSFVNDDHKNAFLEDVNATFYIWPIGCSLFAQNITVDVQGDNTLLSKKTAHTPSDNPTPFLQHDIPHDPLELQWGAMLSYLNWIESGFLYLIPSPEDTPPFLKPFERQLGSGLNSTNDSLVLLGDRLSTMTALQYTLLVQTLHSTVDLGSQIGLDWSPIFATVSGFQSILMACLTVQTLPLIMGIITSSILIFVFAVAARQSISDNVIRDGQVIDMVSLLHNSSLPTIIANGDEGLQRIQAMQTHVLYNGITIDVDYIQKRHHTPSPGVPFRPLDSHNPQDENLPIRESIGGPPPRPSHPGSQQPSQSQERTHWFFAGHQPYIITYTVTTVFLAASYLLLIGLWSHHLFDHTSFSVARLGQVNQFVSVISQAWAVATISLIAFTVQAIASDLAIQHCQTVAALHDTLGSWLGVVYAAVALFRSQDHLQTRLRLFLALVFFVSISILHISTPSVITVHAVNSTVAFDAPVVKMPGNLSHIPVSDQSKADLFLVLPSIPYLWDQRNSGVGLPMGYNGTTLFSTLAKPTHGTDGSVFFEDPYARNIAVQCASVADSPHNMLNITYRPHNASNIEHAPAYENLSFDLRLTVSISQNTTMKFISSPNLAQYGIMSGYDFSFGGRKVSSGAPPNYWMNDVLAYLPWHQPNAMEPTNNMSITAFAYISLRPNAFRMSSVGGDVPVAIETRQFQVGTWVEEPSAPTLETLEDLNVTFYIWPIICSLSVHNVTAWVRVRGDTRLERTNASTTVANLTRPSGKWILPSDPMETSWSYIMDLLFLAQQVWISDPATPLEKTFNQTWTLTSLEDQLSRFSAFYYSVLVQHWRTAALNGDLTASSWWNEATGSVAAHQLTLIGRLDVSISQLVLGCVCMIALIITSAISILGVRIHQGALMDGGVMNMISLLRGSSLPGIISGDHDEVLGRDGRRRRAERTIVMFKNSILDVPERLEDEIFLHNSWDDETRGLQSSLGAIALSERVEDERPPINSGGRERTGLQCSMMQTITAPQQQHDEHLPFLSDDPAATDSRTSLWTMTSPEPLEGDDLVDSGDPENFQTTPPQGQEDERLLHSGDPETTGLQSLLRAAIALSERLEDERLNSGDHESTELPYSIQTIPLLQQQEHLPLHSEVPETTDSQSFLQTATLQERLEGDDLLINSGDHENLPNSLRTMGPGSLPSTHSG